MNCKNDFIKDRIFSWLKMFLGELEVTKKFDTLT